VPVDAERWLADRGVTREPIRGPEEPPGRPPVGVREAVELARQSAADAQHVVAPDGSGVDEDDPSSVSASSRGDVESALAFVRRSTANAPQSEGRLRAKLQDRGHDAATVESALARARSERLVDDAALLAALIAERRARGHADARLRRDLRDRGFTGDQVDAALERSAATDPAAAAFAVAREHAARHRTADPETAVRRTVGALVRRGHPEALARKAARDAVYADRESHAAAER
jgi:SOS response regulatory protein OraA/RecX